MFSGTSFVMFSLLTLHTVSDTGDVSEGLQETTVFIIDDAGSPELNHTRIAFYYC